MNKRVAKELVQLFKTQASKPLLENEFIISPESTLDLVKVLIKGPVDSLYVHKFVRLDIAIPANYPYAPPIVTFINHDNSRIHPNMYEDGKCCATILNTWGESLGEKWTSSMSIESVIVGFMSLLDNDPYAHEPGDKGNVSYNVYVLHQTFCTCLLLYLEREEDSTFFIYINEYIQKNIGVMSEQLRRLDKQYRKGEYFTLCFEIYEYVIDYDSIREELFDWYVEYTSTDTPVLEHAPAPPTDVTHKCEICYDTKYNVELCMTIECGHQFHSLCLEKHLREVHNLCPLCRTPVSDLDATLVTNGFITTRAGNRYVRSVSVHS